MQAIRCARKLRVGLVNIMPNPEEYAKSIHYALAQENSLFDLLPIRLRSHRYRRSRVVERYFWSHDVAARTPLDLLIVTGAPVEHRPFEEIRYWDELCELFTLAQERFISTLGICFGGLAIAGFLGMNKRVFSEKHFGVYSMPVSPGGERYIGTGRRQLNMAMSTWALLDESQSAPLRNGSIQTLARHPTLGPLVLATANHKFVMVLGHPEYSVDHLFREWQRDLAKGIPYTCNFNRESFREMELRLKSGGSPILANWLRSHFHHIPSPLLQEQSA
jgi:homoserine O-succinyltransferase